MYLFWYNVKQIFKYAFDADGGQIFNLFILEILGTKVLFNLQLP
jgi:hypothetical protein